MVDWEADVSGAYVDDWEADISGAYVDDWLAVLYDSPRGESDFLSTGLRTFDQSGVLYV